MNNNSQQTVNQRIKIAIDSLKITQKAFSEVIGISEKVTSNVKKGKNPPNFLMIESIIRHFPQINARWLILGEGDMWDFEPEDDMDVSAMEAHEQRLEYMVRSVHEPQIEQVEASNIMLLQEKIAMLQMLLTAKEQLIDSQKREIELLRK